MVENIIQSIFVLLVVFLPLRKVPEKVKEISFSREYTNFLRALAIIMVVMHHVSNYYSCRYLTPFGGIGVAIFLVISGYGLNESYKKKGLSNFWSNKFIRVIVPFWIVTCIVSIITIHSFNLEKFINTLFCIKANWYVRYLFYWYCLFYVSTRFFYKWRLYFYFICGCFMLFLPEIEAEQSFSFFIGFLISYTKDSSYSILRFLYKCKYPIFICGLIFLVLKQDPYIRTFQGTIIFNIIQHVIKLSLGLSVSLLLFSFFKKYDNKVLNYIGEISYELYLTHCVLLSILGMFVNNYLNIALYYVCTFICTILLYKLDNKINIIYKKWQK